MTVRPVISLQLNYKSSYTDTKVSFFLALGKTLGPMTAYVSLSKKFTDLGFCFVLIDLGRAQILLLVKTLLQEK